MRITGQVKKLEARFELLEKALETIQAKAPSIEKIVAAKSE